MTASQKRKSLGGASELPALWQSFFRRGAPVETDLTRLPPFDELRTKLQEHHAVIDLKVQSCSEEHFGRPAFPDNAGGPSNLSFIFFLAAHDFYHSGQIMMIRRSLGRDRLFG